MVILFLSLSPLCGCSVLWIRCCNVWATPVLCSNTSYPKSTQVTSTLPRPRWTETSSKVLNIFFFLTCLFLPYDLSYLMSFFFCGFSSSFRHRPSRIMEERWRRRRLVLIQRGQPDSFEEPGAFKRRVFFFFFQISCLNATHSLCRFKSLLHGSWGITSKMPRNFSDTFWKVCTKMWIVLPSNPDLSNMTFPII